ncbi:MAG: FtsX-like permease family protein [Chloroflexota bacterium]
MIRLLSPRWRKVIRDMWQNKTRTALVVMSVGVGVFAIGVVLGAQRTFLTALNDSFGASNPASGRVFVNGEFGDGLVNTVARIRGVAVVEGRRSANLRYRLNPDDEWQTVDLSTVADFQEMQISRILPKGGAWPPPDKKMLVETTSLEYLGAEIGDPIYVETSTGKIRTMEIAGIVRDQNGPPASVTGVPSGYVNRETLDWLNESRNFTQLAFTVSENPLDEDHIEAIGEEIKKKIENSGLEVIFVRVPPPGQHPLNTILQPLLLVLTGLGGLALALSGFLVINIISAILSQQTRQIGIMKSIGARRGQIVRLFLTMALAYGILALLVAVPLGAIGAWGLTMFMADFFNVELAGFSFSPTVVVIQAVIALIVPLGAAIIPVITGTRITVREAISDYGLGKGQFGTNWFDRFVQKVRGLSRPSMIALRNTFRRKTRLILTLFTLTLAGMTFITIFTVRDSMLATLDNILSLWQFDINVTLERPYRVNRIEQVLNQFSDDIAAYESWGDTSVRVARDDDTEGDNLRLTGLPAQTTMLAPDVLEGRWLLPEDTGALVVNTDFIQDEPDVKVGDTVTLKIGASKNTTWRVVGLIQGTTVGAGLYVNYDYYTQLMSEVNQAGEIQLSVTNKEPEAQDELARRLEVEFERAGLGVARITPISEIRSRVEFGFNFLLTFLLSMAMILAIVGGLGLSGTMSINVIERVREIGVMRAIGASDGAVLRIVLVEGMIIGFISWCVGAALAFPISRVLSDQLGIAFLENPLKYTYSLVGLSIWLSIAVFLSIIASYLPARSASRLTVREVLAYEG